MGCFAGPKVETSQLAVAFDAANKKSLNVPTQADHGYADWYCLVSGTATYSIINSSGGSIYENNAGSITTLVTATGPQRGTISVTTGRTYYGSVPINLVVEDGHHHIIPLTMMGTQFWNIAVRGNPSTYYVYSPYQSATVNFYDNTVGGLTGTPTSTLSLSAGQSGTFSSNALTNHWISSTAPIIASATQIGLDKTILSPMSRYVYYRYSQYLNTTNSTTPTNNNANVTYDSTYNVMNMQIGDGGGGDCAQGLGLEYLSDTYSWGNVLSDYVIVCPYTATVTASYWNGSAWVVRETHSNISGTITSPGAVSRDGWTGVGIAATTIAGFSANMVSDTTTLWKWEGTAPFYLAINDNADDEFSVLGWLSSRNTSPRSSNIITDITGGGNTGALTYGPTYNSTDGGAIVFDGSNDCVVVNSNASVLSNTAYTKTVWFYVTSFATNNNLISGGNNGRHAFSVSSSNKLQAGHNSTWDTISSPTPLSLNTWYHAAVTFSTTTGWRLYLNGVLDSTNSSTSTVFSAYDVADALFAEVPYGVGYGATTTFLGSGEILLGAYGTGSNAFSGRISNAFVYNRVLSASEIQQNFNALRGRFGL